jgi:hypothetical protein
MLIGQPRVSTYEVSPMPQIYISRELLRKLNMRRAAHEMTQGAFIELCIDGEDCVLDHYDEAMEDQKES